jgi:hypothetical protein
VRGRYDEKKKIGQHKKSLAPAPEFRSTLDGENDFFANTQDVKLVLIENKAALAFGRMIGISNDLNAFE